MNTYSDKTQENNSRSVANSIPSKNDSKSVSRFADFRQETVAQRKRQEMADNRSTFKGNVPRGITNLGATVIQGVFGEWGWATPHPSGAQLLSARADILASMQAVNAGWGRSANTHVTRLPTAVVKAPQPAPPALAPAAPAPAPAAPVTVPAHITIKNTDVDAAVRSGVVAGDDQNATRGRVARKNWHATIEHLGRSNANNPHYFSDTAAWTKIGAYDPAVVQTVVTEGTQEMTALR